MKIEGRIYDHLGKHKQTARCLSWSYNFVDLRYGCNGDTEPYLKQNLTSYRA